MRTRRSPLLALLAALSLGLPPRMLSLPAAFILDGVRDPSYVLIAEDPAADLAPAVAAQAKYLWADLTRLFVGSDATNLYVYAELLQYTRALAVGEIGLSIVLPAGDALGPRADPLRAQRIAFNYDAANPRGCPADALLPTRHPDVLIRGLIVGQPGDGFDTSNGFTLLFASGPADWTTTGTDWGGLNNPSVDDRIAYVDGAGVELLIPWTDLGLAGPESLLISFFTSSANPFVPGNFDAVPPDIQAAAAPTSTVLTQLANFGQPLPAPASVSLTCGPETVAEEAGALTLSAQLHGTFTQTVALSYTAAALTAGPADFAVQTGTLTFSPLSTVKSFDIAISDDTMVEGPESFLVTLSASPALGLTIPYTRTVTIVDNDLVSIFKLFLPFTRR